MRNTKKIKYILLVLVSLGFIIFLVTWQSNKAQIASPTFPPYSKKDSKESEKVIRDAFFYENEHDLEKLRGLYSSRHANSDFRLFNLSNIKLLEIELPEQKDYPALNPKLNIERKNMIRYKVKYYVEFKDQTIEPMDNGEYEIYYFLIKENNRGDWKIESTGV
ncbi:DUF4829 domain-containing protein [Desulfitobacterium sp.]|uniref:DUF4829 domain-containing protein n=1 Tax=Desulfitobacterium sp. TaxID=49981 RepID=UPI002B204701|nr:DUF4829 domain-containing protein [Desulfitobacterium sp.]MEA4901027.1 DUF4829 domain-containing protein [Desulfitobacterium sp.]